MTETARILREARERLGVSQGSVAKSLGLTTPQFISNVERGVSLLPVGIAKKLHKILDISKADLVSAFLKDSEARLVRDVNKYAKRLGK